MLEYHVAVRRIGPARQASQTTPGGVATSCEEDLEDNTRCMQHTAGTCVTDGGPQHAVVCRP